MTPRGVAIPCHRCGYDLSGHAGRGACPECGDPVASSLEAPTLRTLDAKWVRRLRTSVALMAIAALALGQARAFADLAAVKASPFVVLAVGIAWVALIWMTTIPHPALVGASSERGRRIARALSPAPAIAAAVAFGQLYTPITMVPDQVIRAMVAVPGAVAIWTASEYPIALLAQSGYESRRRSHPSWALALTYMLAEIGNFWAIAAAYTGILAALGFYRILVEIQMREIGATRRRRTPAVTDT